MKRLIVFTICYFAIIQLSAQNRYDNLLDYDFSWKTPTYNYNPNNGIRNNATTSDLCELEKLQRFRDVILPFIDALNKGRENYIAKNNYDFFQESNSSWIRAAEIFYLEGNHNTGLILLYTSENVYLYGFLKGGAKQVWNGWKIAPSKGGYFHKYVKQNNFYGNLQYCD